MLKADNRILEAKCNYYIKEMEIVGWYINVMEGGVDATQAMKNYAKVRDERKALEKQLEAERTKHNIEIANLAKKLKDTQAQLIKQHYQVTKPLIQEVKVQEEINRRQAKELEMRTQDIKKMTHVLRLPRMTDMY